MFQFVSPLLALSVFAVANGYLMTLIPLLINDRQGSDLLAGYLGGIYYFGLLAGSFRSERTVIRVGHIRSFASYMGLLCSSTLGMALTDSFIAWGVLRFLNGFSVAGIFVVIESWLLCESEHNNRGRVLAFYMVTLYGANALGQLLVGVYATESLLPFVLIPLLFSLAILPLALTRVPAPVLNAGASLSIVKLIKLTPSAMVGCMAGGMVLGALYSLLPIELYEQTGNSKTVAFLLTVTMFGGMLLQYPVGLYSDYVDRRKVLFAISVLGSLCCLAYLWSNHDHWLSVVLLFLVGGTTFTLYPLAISHGCDHLKPEEIVGGTQGLLFSYSCGACIGPVFGGFVMHSLSVGVMFYFAVIMGITALFFLIRVPFRPAILTGEDQAFVALPRTTPVVGQISPRADDFPEEDTCDDAMEKEL